jgi:hypothetical protein
MDLKVIGAGTPFPSLQHVFEARRTYQLHSRDCRGSVDSAMHRTPHQEEAGIVRSNVNSIVFGGLFISSSLSCVSYL